MATDAEQELKRRTRRSLLGLGAGAVVAGAAIYKVSGYDENGDIPRALRRILGFNEQVSRSTLYSNSRLAKTFPKSAIGKLKSNGPIGVEEPVDAASWCFDVYPYGATKPSAKLDLADIQKLPRYEQTIEFKCIEGWSAVTSFAGARFSEFTAKFAPGSEKAPWVAMETPNRKYYVGVEMESMLHPQTLLAWEMNGQPLNDDHGKPLRLVIPVKYGIKNIKRIGRISYVDKRPADYWAEEGYDYYAGL